MKDPVWWMETIPAPVYSGFPQTVIFYLTTASCMVYDTSGLKEKIMGFDHAFEMNLADQRRAAYHRKQRGEHDKPKP